MPRTLERSTRIEAPPAVVWRALTDADELTKWFSPAARVTPGIGGEIWLSWGEGMSGGTRIVAWDPSRHLGTVADAPDDSGREPGTIDWFLEGDGGGTRLRLVQGGLGSEAELESLDQGWTIYLYNLKHLLERHRGEPGGQHYAFVPAPGSAEESWERKAAALAERALEPGMRVEVADTKGEVVIAEPGRLLGIRLDEPADALLQLMFVQGAVMASLHLFGTDPQEARDAWTRAVLFAGD